MISKNPDQQSIADKELIFDEVILINKDPYETVSQNRSPSLAELKTLELEREWVTGDMGTDKDVENKETGIQEDTSWERNCDHAQKGKTTSDGSNYNKNRFFGER